ncbi:MAG: hydroxylamine reductase [Candidatus Methanomethylophilaceae archaeon]|jgi:hydroxylamine reductase|nr:hydroxylamine reductase [Candidatus Methanomethylophilaceae archaeon]NLF33455.1 hydroxylamine reductase [Thermoplasmatales archaeon]
MRCRQCEETIKNGGCTKIGVCGKTPEVADAQDLLIQSLMVLSKAAEEKDLPADVLADIDARVADGLFMTLTNTNFDLDTIQSCFRENKALIKELDAACHFCGTSHPPEGVGIESFDRNADLRSLKELLLAGLKGLAAYYHHAVVLGRTDEEVEAFLRKGLAAIRKDLSADELVALNMECGEAGVTCMALLDKANTDTFGTPEITVVKTGVGKNPGILISGHDLKDLRMLLEQTRGTGIDVYTHGEMLPANAYPELKRYDNLVGNYGGAWYEQKKEFASFNGPILLTTNCVLIPTDEYKDRLFTTGVAGVSGVKYIPADVNGDKDFSEIIMMAKGCKPPEKIDDMELVIGLAHGTVLSLADKVVDAVKTGAIKRFVVMAGCDGREKGRTYYTEFAKALPADTVILTAGCAKYRYNKLGLGDIGGIPRVIDAGQCNDCYSLVVIADALSKAFGVSINELPLSFNIAWFEQKACLVLLSLLHLGIKDIMLGPRLPEFVTPAILDVLVGTFGLKANGEVGSDMRILRIEA